MSELGAEHRAAAEAHDDAARRHDEDAARWAALGDHGRSRLAVWAGLLERAEAEFERACAAVVEGRGDDRT